jgi:hypothetical protein
VPLVVLIGLAAALASCSGSGAQQSEGPQPRRVAGCYSLTLWPGESGPEMERRRAAWGSAPLVKLDTVALVGWPSVTQRYGQAFAAQSITDAGRIQDHPFGYWRFMGSDSLFVGHPGALAGVSMELVIRGQDLGGEIVSFTDVPREGRPSTAKSPVLARRVTCPDP